LGVRQIEKRITAVRVFESRNAILFEHPGARQQPAISGDMTLSISDVNGP